MADFWQHRRRRWAEAAQVVIDAPDDYNAAAAIIGLLKAQNIYYFANPLKPGSLTYHDFNLKGIN